MTHAEARVHERLAEAGYDRDTRNRIFAAAKALAPKTDPEGEAIRLLVLPEQVGEMYGERSNGNEVWAIYRNRYLVTTMLRRSGQPDANLRVKKVTRL